MTDLATTIAVACGVFVGTNIDDIVVLTVLFLTSRARGKPRPWQIVAGQYAGIGALIAVSALAALGLAAVPSRWVGLLCFVPIGLGFWGLIKALRARHNDEQPSPVVAAGLASVAAWCAAGA